MRDSSRTGLIVLLAVIYLGAFGCADPSPEKVEVPAGGDLARSAAQPALKTAAIARAARRAYDGAPPVVAHENFGITCTECHDREGMAIEDVGFAPPSPHEITAGMSAISRCTQCHVFKQTNEVFVANRFAGLLQDLRSGARLNAHAPPTIPHKTFMRENCTACHSGPAAREEIRSSHPERTRCRQCHVPVKTRTRFTPG